jgi:hypothetical protein
MFEVMRMEGSAHFGQWLDPVRCVIRHKLLSFRAFGR